VQIRNAVVQLRCADCVGDRGPVDERFLEGRGANSQLATGRVDAGIAVKYELGVGTHLIGHQKGHAVALA